MNKSCMFGVFATNLIALWICRSNPNWHTTVRGKKVIGRLARKNKMQLLLVALCLVGEIATASEGNMPIFGTRSATTNKTSLALCHLLLLLLCDY